MMILLLAALAAAAGPIEAERLYSARAQTDGQWTAFRATAAPDALMFVPEPVHALEWLRGRADPPVSVIWWPARGWISCDNTLAVNFGPWLRHGGKQAGTFTTIWSLAGGVWKWRLDRGNSTPVPLAAGDRPHVTRASCQRVRAAASAALTGRPDSDPLVAIGDSAPIGALPQEPEILGTLVEEGASADFSMRWEVRRMAGKDEKSHLLRVWRWNGSALMLCVFETSDPV